MPILQRVGATILVSAVSLACALPARCAGTTSGGSTPWAQRVADATPSAAKPVTGNLGQVLFNGKLRVRIEVVRDETADESADLHPGPDQKVVRVEGIVRNGTHETVTVRPDYTLFDHDAHLHKVGVLELSTVTLAQGGVGRQLIRTLAPRSFRPDSVLVEPGQLFGRSFRISTTPAAAGRASHSDGSPDTISGQPATHKPDAGGANQVKAVTGTLGQLLSNGKVRVQIDVVREESPEESADLHPFADQKVMRIEGAVVNLSREEVLLRPGYILADQDGVTCAVGVLDLKAVSLRPGARGTQLIRTLVPKTLGPTKLLVSPGDLYGKPFRISL
jgi:hypothetical protein